MLRGREPTVADMALHAVMDDLRLSRTTTSGFSPAFTFQSTALPPRFVIAGKTVPNAVVMLRSTLICCDMELRHLRYFMAVGEELSFTRAAERLHIAQPPLSQQIKQLEEELGVTLLQRGARPLRLTDAGEVLLQRSRTILADLDAAMAETRRTGRGQTGKLSVGFAGSAMYVFLPDVINGFREACPNVELNLHEMLACEVAQALQERKIDVGFARPQLPPLDRVAQKLILEEPYLAALPKRHRLAGRSSIALRELVDEPFVLYPSTPGPSVTELFTSACRESGFVPRVAQEARHLQTVVGLVAAGVGVSLVPQAAADGQRRRGVTFVPLSPPVPMAPLTVVWREEDISPALREFLAVTDAERKKLASHVGTICTASEK
ncbi:LysR substrate-binding domain-containing protein [Bradyrhizobium sp. C-145]|uniref:LysR substrate-binding domain-containing protein n=1 Tax=Bradyrhizobium sp. C-145 TaxID=574727 RepID=UPI00201B660E|nr:LysR substrate-binding domain-containing protein [Bradyrhizobium sp. C-145]UQR66644.1 LysR substrate-binding domain-containing protein [Bradyrhizobium sp. C-145]